MISAEGFLDHVNGSTAEAVPDHQQLGRLSGRERIALEAEGRWIVIARPVALEPFGGDARGSAMAYMKCGPDERKRKAGWHREPDQPLHTDPPPVAEWGLDISP